MKRQEHLTEVEEAAIRVRVEGLKNGRYLATSPDVPGLVAEGRSISETVEIAQGVARKIVESCREHGDPLPPVFRNKRGIPCPCRRLLMGRLAGFSYREVVRRLRTFGFQFDRQGPGSHEIWRHSQTGRKVTIPHHTGDLAEGTLRAILREAGIEVGSFLKA